jgi:hypothetical protein
MARGSERFIDQPCHFEDQFEPARRQAFDANHELDALLARMRSSSSCTAGWAPWRCRVAN